MSTARNYMRNRTDRRAQRRVECEERTENWQDLSAKEQLAALDRRLGKGVGATKQRAKLQAIVTLASK